MADRDDVVHDVYKSLHRPDRAADTERDPSYDELAQTLNMHAAALHSASVEIDRLRSELAEREEELRAQHAPLDFEDV